MTRTRCGSCGSNILRPFLDLGRTPLADAFPASADEEETTYPLGLCVCERCWLVQNTEVVPDDLLYNGHYGFYTGASPSSIAYFKEYAEWAIERFHPRVVVEIASNDGTLLRNFADAGCYVIGVEPSANVAAMAGGMEMVVEPFGRRVADELPRADLVVANNVVAHVSDLDDFLGGIADLLAPKGTALIEFQNVADLLVGNQFDHVYHEHRSFFSIESLDSALLQRGLYISWWQQTPAQGGSIRAVVKRGQEVHFSGPAWLRDGRTYAGVQGRVDYIVERIRDLVDERNKVGTVAGYAASAKSTTLLNYCGFTREDIAFVADMTPYKIGRFTPGTKVPIVSGKTLTAATHLLLAWNYLPGVLRRERDYLDRGGRFIVPIPVPVLL